MEIEADQLAQRIMTNGQYDVEAGRVFFQKLSGGSSENDAFEFLRTHPLGNTRSSNLSGQTADVVEKEEPLFNALKAQIQKIPYAFNPDNSNSISDDPNLIYASILAGNKNKISSNTLKQLRELVLNYPSFLPGLALYLSTLHQIQSDELCKVMDIADKRFKNEFLTLDVLQTLKSAANQCSHASAQYWHSQLLWQSGKEPEALAFLSQSLNLERDTNKAARLKSRLQLLTERYERFR
jgi:predicted Zn-dependent protease